jgi:hypothetical protein
VRVLLWGKYEGTTGSVRERERERERESERAIQYKVTLRTLAPLPLGGVARAGLSAPGRASATDFLPLPL